MGEWSVPSLLLTPGSSLTASEESVTLRLSWGVVVLHTRMAASDTQECTSYLSWVKACKAELQD